MERCRGLCCLALSPGGFVVVVVMLSVIYCVFGLQHTRC